MTQNVILALMLTALAGLSTGIGSAIAYFIRRPKIVYLSFSLGFSAGVMIYISFVELLAGAIKAVGELYSVSAFFIGFLVICAIDMSIPEPENPHHYKEPQDMATFDKNGALMRSGLLTALAIAIHNFPEGLATFATALSDVKLGVITAIAIAIHNIPEGISVSVPIFYATGDRKKAFIYSFLSGITEIIGAVLGYIILRPFLSESLLAGLLAAVAGIMVYISLDEVLPTAHHYGHGHVVVMGLSLGMIIMALSLIML